MVILNKRDHYYRIRSGGSSGQDGDHWGIQMSYIFPCQGLGAVAAFGVDIHTCAVCALHNGTQLRRGTWGLTLDTCQIPRQAPW